jgi:hypothetical protein
VSFRALDRKEAVELGGFELSWGRGQNIFSHKFHLSRWGLMTSEEILPRIF